MFTLTEGICLEDSNKIKILRWGCSRQEALNVGNPVYDDVEDSLIECHGIILDGLRSCTLIVDLSKNKTLSNVRVQLHHWPNSDHDTCVRMQYQILSKHLTEKIGQPSSKSIGRWDIEPPLTWQHDGCLLELVSADCGHPSFTSLIISKKID